MGKQIPVKLSREKEKEFMKFLKRNNSVVIYPWTEDKKLLILNEILPAGPYLYHLDIWNKKFPLKPEFIEIKEEYRKNEYKYSFHRLGKPVIEYSRGPIYRIYWDKDFGITHREYDIEEFEKWYNQVVEWIKKNCKKEKGVYVG